MTARVLVAGEAQGPALVLQHGFSFAMAFEVESGRIRSGDVAAERRDVAGHVLVMPRGLGSSSASTSLAEAIRLGTAPRGIVLAESDQILAIGAMVARTLYGRTCPIVVLDPAEHAAIEHGSFVSIAADGSVRVTTP